MRRRIRGDVGTVDDKHQVKLGGLRLFGLGAIPIDIDAGIAGDLRVQPFVLCCADAGKDGAEFELPG
ncbi:Uncharacterised protein [Mycobacterium tuberculosis]|nr:Uncharacterised protein [Mycobacterium tuberculosis]